MKTPARRSAAALLLILGVASTFACAADAGSIDKGAVAPRILSDGLTVLEADAKAGKLTIAFKKDGRAVTFDLRLGPPMAEISEADRARTDIPTHEIDAIVRDQEGRGMTTQIGGDRFIDPTWSWKSTGGDSASLDLAVRTADFARVEAAIEALHAWTPPAGLEQLKLGALRAARASRDIDRGEAPRVSGEGGPALGTKQDIINPAGDPYANYYWTYSMWSRVLAYVCVPPAPCVTIAEHSAVRLSLYSSGGTFIDNWESCNHGACAAAANMDKQCVSSKFNDSNDSRYMYLEPSTSTGSGVAGCMTGYTDLGDSAGGSHNCHNDSRLQRYAIVTGSVGEPSRRGDYGSLCAKSDRLSPKSCPSSFGSGLTSSGRTWEDASEGEPMPAPPPTDPSWMAWHLTNAFGGAAQYGPLYFGLTSDYPVAGNWDGVGGATPGVVRAEGSNLHWYMTNSLSGSPAPVDYSLYYGIPGDVPIVGDWDGNGSFTPGVFRVVNGYGYFYLNNSFNNHQVDIAFQLGLSGDVPVAGDWNGDGIFTPGVWRQGTWYLSDNFSGQPPYNTFAYGYGSDVPIVGDWDGDRRWTPGIVRAGTDWYLNDGFGPVATRPMFQYGIPGDRPVPGNWDGVGGSSPGIIR